MADKEKQQQWTEVTLRIPENLKDILEQAATLEGTDLQGLVIQYLEQGVEQIMPKIKREQYFAHLREVMEEHNVPAETIKTLEDNFEY